MKKTSRGKVKHKSWKHKKGAPAGGGLSGRTETEWLRHFNRHAGIDEKMNCKLKLEKALSKCVEGPLPAYLEFKRWSSLMLKREGSLGFHYDEAKDEEISMKGAQAFRLKGAVEKLNNLDPENQQREYSAAYVEFKLLTYIFEDRERGREFIYEMAAGMPSFDNMEFNSKLSQLSPLQLRAEYFKELSNDNAHAARQILGLLRFNADSHDAGELSYLEALIFLKENDFSKAIDTTQGIQPGDCDYKRALRIRLESYAHIGDHHGIVRELEQYGVEALSTGQLLYVRDVLIVNSVQPDIADDSFVEVLKRGAVKKNIFLRKGDPGCVRYVKFHAKVLTELFMRMQDVEQRNMALKQEGDLLEDGLEQRENAGLDAIRKEDPKLYRLIIAVQFDSHAFSASGNHSIGERCQYIDHLLMNTCNQPDFESHYLALKAQYLLGEYRHFVENMLNNKETLLLYKDDRVFELISLAYQTALMERMDEEDALYQLLLEFDNYENVVSECMNKAKEEKVLRTLTPMGRKSYEAAYISLEMAGQSDFAWKDAGMISLGFFRILETEINARIMKRMFGQITEKELSEVWESSFSRIERYLSSEDTSKKNRDKLDKAKNYWKRAESALWDLVRGVGRDMELGPLYIFLKKIQQVQGDDNALKGLFNNSLRMFLTVDGVEAFESGNLSALIEDGVRDKYRNPPAHTRFLPLRTAIECKEYVDSALNSLACWVVEEEHI